MTNFRRRLRDLAFRSELTATITYGILFIICAAAAITVDHLLP